MAEQLRNFYFYKNNLNILNDYNEFVNVECYLPRHMVISLYLRFLIYVGITSLAFDLESVLIEKKYTDLLMKYYEKLDHSNVFIITDK